MIFGPGATVTVDMTSPDEQPVTGVVGEDGKLVMGGNTYTYNPGPPPDYRYRKETEPGKGWYLLEFDASGDVDRYYYPVETGNRIHTGTGSWGAVG